MSKISDTCRPVNRIRVADLVQMEMIMLGLETIPYWIAGSYRRGKMVSNDIDVVLIIDNPEARQLITKAFIARFGSLITDSTAPKMDVIDGRVAYQFKMIEYERLGAMMLHATGSADFNKMLRGLAKSKGYKLNQYGLYQDEKEVLISKDEKDFFTFLGIAYIEPTNRG